MDQNNTPQNYQTSQSPQIEPKYPSMNSSEISNALLALMNELSFLQNEIKAQNEYTQQDIANLRAEILDTPRLSIPSTPNPDSLIPPVPSLTATPAPPV